MFEEIIEPGVVLKPLEVWHAEEFAEHMARGREHIRPWVGPGFVTETVEAARATLQRYASASVNDGARIYGIWDAGVLLGGVMFVSFDAAWGNCELGCWLEPAGVGRGLITGSIELLMAWAFIERKMERIEWRCRTDNERSVAIAHRLLLRSEGVLRSNWVFDGQRYDTAVFSILRPEWLELHGREN